jgi:hypothetical protein
MKAARLLFLLVASILLVACGEKCPICGSKPKESVINKDSGKTIFVCPNHSEQTPHIWSR